MRSYLGLDNGTSGTTTRPLPPPAVHGQQGDDDDHHQAGQHRGPPPPNWLLHGVDEQISGQRVGGALNAACVLTRPNLGQAHSEATPSRCVEARLGNTPEPGAQASTH